ncbi:MAG TPA: hypothetical protein VFM18_00455, partial [Methanosarcina sp.]|nr:hypothetical protein [Methanosarcina sp.]
DAGIDISGATFDGWGYVIQCEWNPLTDDGDAFRLMTKLAQINGFFPLMLKENTAHTELSSNVIIESSDDLNQATRRAIVRAAAEIGKSL